MDDRIQWHQLTQPEYDERVEALFERMYERDPDRRIEVVDGRGGDGGHDIDIYYGDILEEIVQMKYFPEGFSGGHAKSRRSQIKDSFVAAMKDKPEVETRPSQESHQTRMGLGQGFRERLVS